jgi:hypothetical protein
MNNITKDELSVIVLALEELSPDRITSWQLDTFATGSDKSEFIDSLLEKLGA